MKISSPTKDYYDYLAGFSQDTETTFRRPREFFCDVKGENRRLSCGPTAVFRSVYRNATITPTRFADNLNPFWLNFLGTMYFGVIEIDCIHNTLKEGNIRRVMWDEVAEEIARENNYSSKRVMNYSNSVDASKIPISLTINYSRYVNGYYHYAWPTLKDIGFNRVLPPQEAYNEIYKWLCTSGRPDPVIPTMSNDIKIEQAGFDVKQSFRKMPRG